MQYLLLLFSISFLSTATWGATHDLLNGFNCKTNPSEFANRTTGLESVNTYNFLVFEKSKKPQNKLILSSSLDKNCQLVKNKKGKYFGMYWMMNGKTFKRTHAMIQSKVHGRLKFIKQNEIEMTTDFAFTDLRELKHDIEDPTITIKTSRNSTGECQAMAFMTLGPSNQNATIMLSSIYTQVKTRLKIPIGFKWISIKGIDIKTCKEVETKYKKK